MANTIRKVEGVLRSHRLVLCQAQQETEQARRDEERRLASEALATHGGLAQALRAAHAVLGAIPRETLRTVPAELIDQASRIVQGCARLAEDKYRPVEVSRGGIRRQW